MCIWLAVVAMFTWGGCQPLSQSPPATLPETPVYVAHGLGFAVRIPNGWAPATDKQLALLLLPDQRQPRAGGRSGPSMSMDIPALPPHLPGMIRMPLIEDGFVNDLKKRFKDVVVLEGRAIDIPNAQARVLLLTWRDDTRHMKQRAVLMIHAGRVYILRATAPAQSFDVVDQAFDVMLASLEWTD
jgi:hypothetical protein